MLLLANKFFLWCHFYWRHFSYFTFSRLKAAPAYHFKVFFNNCGKIHLLLKICRVTSWTVICFWCRTATGIFNTVFLFVCHTSKFFKFATVWITWSAQLYRTFSPFPRILFFNGLCDIAVAALSCDASADWRFRDVYNLTHGVSNNVSRVHLSKMDRTDHCRVLYPLPNLKPDQDLAIVSVFNYTKMGHLH